MIALGLLALHISVLGRGLVPVIAAAALVSLLLLVTFDLDRPTRGLITVPATPLTNQPEPPRVLLQRLPDRASASPSSGSRYGRGSCPSHCRVRSCEQWGGSAGGQRHARSLRSRHALSRDAAAAGTRRRRRRTRLRRFVVAFAPRRRALVVVTSLLLFVSVRAAKAAPSAAKKTAGKASRAKTVPAAVEAGVLPWHLKEPLNREVVVAQGGSTTLLVAGGLAAGSSVNGIYALDTGSGKLAFRGNLPQPTHDAAAAALSGGILVAGGGTGFPTASDASGSVLLQQRASVRHALPRTAGEPTRRP